MDKRKKIIIAAAVAVAVILSASLIRYMTVVAPREAEQSQEQEGAAEQPIAEEQEGEPEQKDPDKAELPQDVLDCMTQLKRYKWISTRGDTVLTFTYDSMEQARDGSEAEKTELEPLTTLDIGEDGALGPADARIVSCKLGDADVIIYMRLKDFSGERFPNISGVIWDASGANNVYCLTISTMPSVQFIPFEKSAFKVQTGDEAKKIMGGNLDKVEAAIEAYAIEKYPTASEAKWRQLTTIDHETKSYAFVYDLNDTTLAPITVLFRQTDGAVAVVSGDSVPADGIDIDKEAAHVR